MKKEEGTGQLCLVQALTNRRRDQLTLNFNDEAGLHFHAVSKRFLNRRWPSSESYRQSNPDALSVCTSAASACYTSREPLEANNQDRAVTDIEQSYRLLFENGPSQRGSGIATHTR